MCFLVIKAYILEGASSLTSTLSVVVNDADLGENGRLSVSIVHGNANNDFELMPINNGVYELRVTEELDAGWRMIITTQF